MSRFVVVCVFDGTMACGSGEQRPLEDDAKMLMERGASKIYGMVNTAGPFAVCKACHICPTGRVNAFAITREDWIKIESSFVGPAPFMLWSGAPYPDIIAVEPASAPDDTQPVVKMSSLAYGPVLIRDLIGYTVRILTPDSGGTTDYVPDRINFIVNHEGRIEDIYPG